MLQPLAETDYQIAQQFEIPERFHTKIVEGEDSKIMPVVPKSYLDLLDSRIALFEDAIKQMNNELPASTALDIPQSPMVVVTPFSVDEHGVLRPNYAGKQWV